MRKKAPTEHLRRWQFTSQSGREARLNQPLPPRTLHGLTEIVRSGRRRCHPPKCVKAEACPASKLPDDRRPQYCAAIERHLRGFEMAIRKAVPMSAGVNAALTGIILRREAVLAVAGWWMSEVEPFSRDDAGRVTAQAVVDTYRGLLREQAKDLRALGAQRLERPDPSKVFGDALHAAIDATPEPQDASGCDEGADG